MKYRVLRNYKYCLVEDEQRHVEIFENAHNDYISLNHGSLIIKVGFAWDGSSVPLKRFIPQWVYDFDKYCKIASLVHDSLCQLIREELLSKSHKRYIDGLYRDMCIEGGMSKRQANLRYRILRMAPDAGISIRKYPRGKIMEV